MKLKVLKQFHDKVTGVCYKAGSEIEVSDKRGAEILSAPGELGVKVEGSKDKEPKDKEPKDKEPKDKEPKDKNKNK
jgi:hypothetical protein